MSNILVTSMGLSWQVLPKILGFTNPQILDLYRFHPSKDRIAQLRVEFGILPVDEIWVVTTNGKEDQQPDLLQQWHALLEPSVRPVPGLKEWQGIVDAFALPALKIFRISDTDDLMSETEVLHHERGHFADCTACIGICRRRSIAAVCRMRAQSHRRVYPACRLPVWLRCHD